MDKVDRRGPRPRAAIHSSPSGEGGHLSFGEGRRVDPDVVDAELVAKGGDITYFLNDKKILEATDGSYAEGRIMFQSEGAEIFFRLIELHPLK